ncbi:alpha/beta fold hydrolase [Allokutzneria albata]|uniref:Pimeloyl-ACP methyl ester carboxylesterase n=1 Tax=Allokutzneria albata TaxID=211114 RepID=A0A1G9UKK9_ALLAB|nr:alpha/beta fold hydrolase [Allokutzneria albata]SDM60462.1 Pimeloyl-ACP methyl ester carboxylesterase [Allokutzneria albata]
MPIIEVNNVELWVEEFGDPTHPPVLLVMGSMSQGLLWPDELVGRIAAGGRRVIRYDHRDTGRSSALDFDARPYTWADIRDDIVGLLDALGIDRVHLVGHSAGGLLGQWVALEHPERIASLTAIGSSPLGGHEGHVVTRALTGQPQEPGSLPEPKEEFVKLFTSPPPEDPIDFQIELARVLHGSVLPFDADAQRELEERLRDRDRDPATVANHQRAWAADPDFEPEGRLGEITAPTLVIEGSEEPVKPGHGRLIAKEIPGAEYLEIEGMGHTLPPEVHAELAAAVLAHTAR